MIRAFKYFTVAAGGTPQPLIGTTTTAAVPATTNTKDTFVIPVTDGSMFRGGDWALIGQPSTGEERLFVQSVSGNNVTVLAKNGLKNSYLSGVYFRLSVQINSTYVQTKDGNSGYFYIGTEDTMVKATFVFCIAKLTETAAGGQPVDFHDGRSGLANADDSGQWWVDGTTGDGYAPSLGVM
jgi:hypothetical protein